MPDTSRCRGKTCGAEIRWVRTTADKLMPINPEPDLAGNVELLPSGTAVVHAQPDILGGVRYMPHHATCPDVSEFRS